MPLNAYFTAMLEAKRAGRPSFVYRGTTYRRATTPSGLVVYKKGPVVYRSGAEETMSFKEIMIGIHKLSYDEKKRFYVICHNERGFSKDKEDNLYALYKSFKALDPDPQQTLLDNSFLFDKTLKDDIRSDKTKEDIFEYDFNPPNVQSDASTQKKEEAAQKDVYDEGRNQILLRKHQYDEGLKARNQKLLRDAKKIKHPAPAPRPVAHAAPADHRHGTSTNDSFKTTKSHHISYHPQHPLNPNNLYVEGFG